MPTSGVVPIPCSAVADGEVVLPADLKPLTKVLGASARQAARRKVLEHVALSHGKVAVPCKLPPLVAFPSSPVATLLSSPATAASAGSPRRSPRVVSVNYPPVSGNKEPFSPPTQSVLPAPSRRSPMSVSAATVQVIRDLSWQCHSCTYEQDIVPGSRTCIMCHSTRRLIRVPQHAVVGKRQVVRKMRDRTKSLLCYPPYNCPNCRLAERCHDCLHARREKCIIELCNDAKVPLK